MSARVPPGLNAETLRFTDRHFDPGTGRLTLGYALDDRSLREELVFPLPDRVVPEPPAAALDLLHWIAGVSYWKAACPPVLAFDGRRPDTRQAAALDRIYREGLAEFAWNNGLEPGEWPLFTGNDPVPPASGGPAGDAGLAGRALVPLGGGKDSLVALERVRAAGVAASTVSVGRAPLHARTAARTGLPHLTVERRLDPGLGELNRAGAWNGHVPVTAVNSAILAILALITGCRWVVFANERSADRPTRTDVHGRPVNHQFSKSLAFERLFDDWIRRYVAADLAVFSLLRRDTEVAICREFAGLSRYHDVFSSCNRNFHLDGPRTERWCGECPKCRFVFLGLAAFMPPGDLSGIFGRDLLADGAAVDGFRELLDTAGDRPFECVGTGEESRALVLALARSEAWRDHAVVRALAGVAEAAGAPDLAVLLEPAGEHRIPERFRQ